MMRCIAILALLLSALAATSRAASFTVHDARSEREVSEATELFVEGRLVATFDLDARRDEGTAVIQVPDRGGSEPRGQYRYDLCGTITVRADQGAPEVHEVNATGLLRDPGGHGYEALGAADFTLFYLSDPADPTAARSLGQRSGLCHAPVS